jgi:hypothetical protein
MHTVRLAPRHQVIASKATVGTQQNAHFGPALANLGDNARHLFHGTGGRIDARGPQLGYQQMPSAEDVQRQIAVSVIIAVEEPPHM